MSPDVGSYPSAFPFLWLYLAGVLVFGLRFSISLRKVVNQMTAGKKIRYKEYILVLIDDNIMPNSFLNYIFVSRKKYEKNQIPFEIIKHELVHIKQRHSFDLLFVQILQIFLWFNPLIILYRTLVKRNHEFLADEGVLCQHSNPNRYAEILLNQSISFPNQPVINYFKDDLVRDRILMMTKNSSLKLLFIKLTGILPLLAISFFFFSNISIAENAPAELTVLQEFREANAAVNKGKYIQDVFYLDVVINANKDIFIQNLPLQRKELNPTIQKILSLSNMDNHEVVVRIYAHGSLPVGFITDVENDIFRANSNIRTRKRFILETFDTNLNS